MNKKLILLVSVLSLMIIVSGCGFFGSGDGSGELAMFLADAPVNDVDEVNVTLDRVEVHREGAGWETINDFNSGEKTFDLLSLRFDEALLGQQMLPEGTYNQIRLIVAADTKGNENGADAGDSYVVYKDSSKANDDIFIPSGTKTGLKIDHTFTIQDGVITRLVLDNDVSEILKSAGNGGKIILRPTVIDVIDKVISGDVEGQVVKNSDETAITEYDVVVEALDENGDVFKSTVATTEAMDGRNAGAFLLRGLKEGTYTIDAYVADQDGDGIKEYTLPIDQQPGGTNEITVDVTAERTVNLTDLYGKLKLQ